MLMKFLTACRFLLVVPVVGCVLLTAGVVLMGIGRIVTAGTKLVQAGDLSAKAAKAMSLAVIEIIDLFLIGTTRRVAGEGCPLHCIALQFTSEVPNGGTGDGSHSRGVETGPRRGFSKDGAQELGDRAHGTPCVPSGDTRYGDPSG